MECAKCKQPVYEHSAYYDRMLVYFQEQPMHNKCAGEAIALRDTRHNSRMKLAREHAWTPTEDRYNDERYDTMKQSFEI